MKASIYILTCLLLMIIESAMFLVFPVEFFKPDIGIPFIIYTTIFLGPETGLVATLVISLFQEILSNAPQGSIIFTKTCAFILLIFLRGKVFIDSKYSFSYICGGYVLFESILFIIFSLLSRGELKNAINVLVYIIPNSVFTGFVSIFIFVLIEYLNKRFLQREY